MKTLIAVLLLGSVAVPAVAGPSTYVGGVGTNYPAVRKVEARETTPYALTGTETEKSELKFVTVFMPRGTTQMFVSRPVVR